MFYVIEGGAPEMEAAPMTERSAEAPATERAETAPAAPRWPSDWSNVVFAAKFCEATRAALRDDRLAG